MEAFSLASNASVCDSSQTLNEGLTLLDLETPLRRHHDDDPHVDGVVRRSFIACLAMPAPRQHRESIDYRWLSPQEASALPHNHGPPRING
jgi:hypothetical protein